MLARTWMATRFAFTVYPSTLRCSESSPTGDADAGVGTIERELKPLAVVYQCTADELHVLERAPLGRPRDIAPGEARVREALVRPLGVLGAQGDLRQEQA